MTFEAFVCVVLIVRIMASSKPDLLYFDGRGRGEIVRLALTAAGIDFTETLLQTREQYLALKDELLFGQVPMLKIEGQKLFQTNAIVRHAARKGKLLGEKEPEITQIDILYEGSRDFMQGFSGIGFVLDESKVAEIKPSVAKYLTIFNKVLKDNGSTGYHVGSHFTLADVGVLEPVLAVIDYFGEEELKDYPDIEKFFKTVSSLERISKYIKEIRKRKNDSTYVTTVRKVLQF